jgi:hypothetical protein
MQWCLHLDFQKNDALAFPIGRAWRLSTRKRSFNFRLHTSVIEPGNRYQNAQMPEY